MKTTGSRNEEPVGRAYCLTLTERRVEEALRYTNDLSATVDRPLGEFVNRQLNERRLGKETNDAFCAALNRFHYQHGSFADEHSTL